MNKEWIRSSHRSAEFFRGERDPPSDNMLMVRILDATGMFETGWLVYNHSLNNGYGYPK